MNRNVRNTLWFWVVLVVALAVGVSAAIAANTHDTACPTRDHPKQWVVFPPHWECKRTY